jgi:hypothetical protein
MDLPTLDEFMARGPKKFPRNSYVIEPGFSSLYVRWGFHLVDGDMLACFDIANAEVEVKGKGTFKKLIAKIRANYPCVPIYAESVLNERLAKSLPRMGFKSVEGSMPPSFVLMP